MRTCYPVHGRTRALLRPFDHNQRRDGRYARTIGVLQRDITTAQKRLWAGILVRNLMKTFVALGSRGIVIKKVYGRSDTVEGLRLMHDMGFTQIRTATSHKNFVIDVETSGIEMVLRYEKALNQWRQKYEGDGI